MSHGVDTDLVADDCVYEVVAKRLQLPLSETKASALSNHRADFGEPEEAFDRLLDIDLEGLRELVPLRSKVLGSLDEVGGRVRVVVVPTSGRSSGHAP